MPEKYDVSIESRPTLHLKGLICYGPGDWRDVEAFVPVCDATLTEPVLGPQGGFRGAELRNHTGRIVWTFYKGQGDFYQRVKAAIMKAVGHA